MGHGSLVVESLILAHTNIWREVRSRLTVDSINSLISLYGAVLEEVPACSVLEESAWGWSTEHAAI